MKWKTLHRIIYIWAIAILLSLASCQEYEPFDGQNLSTYQYEKAFVQTFGYPIPNHDWGFVDQPIMKVGTETRAGFIDVNKNEWYTRYHQNLTIPGFPDHLHGYYRGTNTVNNDGSYKKIVTETEVTANSATDPNWTSNNVGSPVGDITEEERNYVYNWFSTHQNPANTSIYWDSFFIQYVDSWSRRNPDATPTRNMDYLCCLGTDGEWTHVNNFNGTTPEIQYVINAGTENWRYKASHSSTDVAGRFVVQHLIFSINDPDCPYGCDVHHYDGWYLGLDYHSVKGDDNDVEADGIYNDWIFKIDPGNQVGYPQTVRVMCEDLGSDSDWDFNDVVFDVSFKEVDSKIYACIALQAAGGTLPITVGTTDMRYEAHGRLGGATTEPIIHPATFAYYEVEYNGTFNADNTINAKNVPIYVNGQDEAIYYTINYSAIAEKFACPNYVRWTEECQNILELYPLLSSWVQKGRSVNWWGSDPGPETPNWNEHPVVTPEELVEVIPEVPEVSPEEPETEPEKPADEKTDCSPITLWNGSVSMTGYSSNNKFDVQIPSDYKAYTKLTVYYKLEGTKAAMSIQSAYYQAFENTDVKNITDGTMVSWTLSQKDIAQIKNQGGVVVLNNTGTSDIITINQIILE